MAYVRVPRSLLGLSGQSLSLDTKPFQVYDAKTGRIKSSVFHVEKHNPPNSGITSDVPDRTDQPSAIPPRTPEVSPLRRTALLPDGGSIWPTKAPVVSSGSDYSHKSQSQGSSPPTSVATMVSGLAKPEPGTTPGCRGSKKRKQRPTNKAKDGSSASAKVKLATTLLDHDPVPDILNDSIWIRLGFRRRPQCDFVEPSPVAEANPFVNHEAVRHLRDLLDGKRPPSDLYVPKTSAEKQPNTIRKPAVDSVPNGLSNGLPEGYHEGLPVSIPDQSNPPPWESAFLPDTTNLPKPPAPTKVSSSSNQDVYVDAPTVKPPSSSPTWATEPDDSGRKKAYLPPGAFAHPLSPTPDSEAKKHTVPLCPNVLNSPKNNLSVRGIVSLGKCSLCERPLDELRYSRWEQDDGPEHQDGQINRKQTQTTLAEVGGRGQIFWSRHHRYGYDDPVISSCANCSGTWHRQCTERYMKLQEQAGKKLECPACGDLWL